VVAFYISVTYISILFFNLRSIFQSELLLRHFKVKFHTSFLFFPRFSHAKPIILITLTTPDEIYKYKVHSYAIF
jgi:hypothetical protein